MNGYRDRIGIDVRTVRLPPWKLGVLAALGGALVLAATIAVAGLFLILVPVVLVGGLVARFLLRGAAAPPTPARQGPKVIEGRYEVLDAPDSHAPR